MTGSRNITGTVDKALHLLSLFTEHRPDFGLGELARLSGFDKATARRLLLAAERHGLVDEVVGIAAPIFARNGDACAVLAVTTPVSRMNETRAAIIVAAISLTGESGAEPPDPFLATAA